MLANMKKVIEFDTVIKREGDNDISYADIPFDVEKEFGKKRVKIRALMDSVEYRGLLTPYDGRYFLLIRKDIRAEIGKTFGDIIHVSIEEDTVPRVVEVPPFLVDKMAMAGVKDFFDSLSFTHQKEYVRWIEEAKRDETRQIRLEKMMEMLKNKIKSR